MAAAPTRVLLVDDEITDALLVQRSLRAGGGSGECFSLQHAVTLAQGIEHLDRSPVDVLLLDLQLPDSVGATTIARLRERDRRIPLVVLTGRDDPELVGRAFEAGADEFLVKRDLHAGLLRRTLRHAIERRRAQPAPAVAPLAADRLDGSGGLLHDLKNLHTSILGNAQILERETRGQGFLRQRVAALLGAARIAADLIRRISEEGDAGEEKVELLELSALVGRCEALLRAVVPERIALQLDLAADLAPIAAAPEAMRRVLLELVVNAVEAIGDAEGRIVVRTGSAELAASDVRALAAAREIAPGPHAWFEVRDDGAGFDRATLARLFDRGYSTKGVGRGQGLGHVREILAGCRAGLLVCSRPSEGSAFRVVLPARGGA